MNPAPMNPKPTCRSYTEDFTNTVVQEADDWAPTSTNVDMVNLSGSKSAYQIENGMLKLRMMQPEFNANGKPKTEGVAATLDMAFEMQYGAIEVRMKTSPVNGVCTSINTMSENGDEIDIEMAPHYFNTQPPSIQEYNYFYRRQGSGPPGVTHGGYVDLKYNTSADFHVYRAEWNTDSIIWRTDGKIVHVQNKNETFDGTNYIFPTEPSRIELGIWDAGFANSGWSGGPIPWHQYKEVNAWFDYVKIECNPIYNHVIPARASQTSKAVSLNVNLDAEAPRNLNKTLPGGIKIGRHASPGIPPKDTKVIVGKVADAGYNHASPGSASSKSIEQI
ncbi:hypothetical protein K450DRAFT_216781 [Umbelopsis ramanniana AG]|uniref:GH16 domain-containing protein n=1 Tax=Umbelopsis ramanniana AG TaxID=1314678 RepID=A0AAD5EIM8_UMBRA|nr:uncharacterized protein K450DRAFT_216781 [Umbelopsis ramanniana AG]KAI8584533.1 hypothetical protein K450DRAFT_216781 [Umbelopsis ramanniana AG]